MCGVWRPQIIREVSKYPIKGKIDAGMKRKRRGRFGGAHGRFNPSLGKHQSVCMENCSVSNNVPLLGPSEMGTSGCDWEMETDWELRQTKPGADAANGSQIKQESSVQRLQDQDAFVESDLLTDSPTISGFCGLFPPAGIFRSLEYPRGHGCPSTFQPPLPHPFLSSLCSTENSRLSDPALGFHKFFRNLNI